MSELQRKKKMTNAQLEHRLKNAVVLVEKTSDTKSVYFSDRCLRLSVTGDYAIVETLFHRHVFSFTSLSGYSRPYYFTSQIIDIALAHDCSTEDGDSFAKLVDVLKADESERASYNLVVYYDWWLLNIFSPLYRIDESELSSFLVYEDYLHNIALNAVLMRERKQDMTNLEFLDAMYELMKEFTATLDERVILRAKSDEEVMQEHIESMREHISESVVDERLRSE